MAKKDEAKTGEAAVKSPSVAELAAELAELKMALKKRGVL